MLSSYLEVIKHQDNLTKLERDKWNKENPPDKTVDIEDNTYGIWFNFDSGVYWGIKYKNGFDLHQLQRIPHEIVEIIKKEKS